MKSQTASRATSYARFASLLLLPLFAACGEDSPAACCEALPTSVRVVNAFTSPVDVLVDGAVIISALAAGAIDTGSAAVGNHTVVLRPTNGAASVTQSLATTTGGMSTMAAVRASNGSVASAVLDDTNSVVPGGATKLRVLHLAPNAGTLQVFRTQPDFQQPISWQFPFDYQPTPTSLSAPFYQSTIGSWEVRVWKTPADASGWANAPLKLVIPLASGEKRTVLLLDAPGGGVRAEIL